MVDDIVLTPEEQVEQTKQWLKKNLPSIVIGLALGVALVYGYTSYSDSKLSKAASASAIYENILSSDNPAEQAASEVIQFKDEYAATPYASKVVLLNAKYLIEQGQTEKALEEFEWVVDNADEELIKSIANLRQAEVLVAEGQLSKAEEIIAETPPLGFESNFFELKGDIAAANKDYGLAEDYYNQALENTDPQLGYTTYLVIKINKMKSLSKVNS